VLALPVSSQSLGINTYSSTDPPAIWGSNCRGVRGRLYKTIAATEALFATARSSPRAGAVVAGEDLTVSTSMR
jgi:hypothetical protein